MTVVTNKPSPVEPNIKSSRICKILELFWKVVFPDLVDVFTFLALAYFVKWLSMKKSEATVVAY